MCRAKNIKPKRETIPRMKAVRHMCDITQEIVIFCFTEQY